LLTGIRACFRSLRQRLADIFCGSHHCDETVKEKVMNNDRIQGNWTQFKGKVKEQWGKLTDDDLDIIAGKRDQLIGRVQERHGVRREDAERQLTDWEKRNTDFRWE
jgi:uncharacterized protein YjbJ (UPF0337 family)